MLYFTHITKFFQHLEDDQITGANIVMDSVRFHHADDVEKLVGDAGHFLVYLPAYSPFLNPIENLFNQLKHYVKKFKSKNADGVYHGISLASEIIYENDCKNYY